MNAHVVIQRLILLFWFVKSIATANHLHRKIKTSVGIKWGHHLSKKLYKIVQVNNECGVLKCWKTEAQ